MDFDLRSLAGGEITDRLPETPHDLPFNRARVDDLLVRARAGEALDLLTELLNCVDWRSAFVDRDGGPIVLEDITRLIAYYRRKFADIGPVYLADLLSTEFITEQRARGDIDFSDRLMQLGREEPALWLEIRNFFRRKEFATALLAMAQASHDGHRQPAREENMESNA
jgi:hypothetical protein